MQNQLEESYIEADLYMDAGFYSMYEGGVMDWTATLVSRP
jgi:hypothetical protein